MTNNKRNNYIDGQFVDVDDFQTEQNYFLDKIKDSTRHLGNSGVTDLQGLQVIPDSTMAEPIPSAAVAVAIDPSPDINVPNPQNYTKFPLLTTDSSTALYTVFQTKTKNIQRIDLRITLDQAATSEPLDVIVRLRQLVDSTNPLSPVANIPPLAQIQLEQSDIPELGSDEFVNLDFSNENSGQGVAVLPNAYYAVALEFRRPVLSSSKIRIFHGPLDQVDLINPDLFTWVLNSGVYAQGFNDENGIFQQFQIYHKVLTTAIKVTPGQAHIGGNQVTVEEDQFRFVEIADRRSVDNNGNLVSNYIILRYAEVFTDPEEIPSTRNPIDTRILDSAIVEALTQPQWEVLLADESQVDQYLFLAVVNDSNIVSIFNKETFTVPSNSTNLAFHDWLNPNNIVPISEAVTLQTARPSDFIFFVANVPAQVPLTDAFGTVQREPTTVRDEFGNIIRRAGDPVLDDIVRVVVNMSFDDGKNTRSLELAIVSEVGVDRQFRNYASTISNLTDNPFDNVFSFNFNTDQLAPNVVYNFVAFTKRGLPIFIQDYNHVVSQTTETDTVETIRTETFTVFLDQSSKTAVINKDLQLGPFNPASDTPQPGVVQYVPTLVTQEIPTPIGVAPTEVVDFNRLDTLVSEGSFVFKPVPMVRLDGTTKIQNLDTAVQAAYDAADITIFVDNSDGRGPIDITFSGSTNRDKGGSGNPVLITGTIDPAVPLSADNVWEVKVRNTDQKDNTNYSSLFLPFGPAQVGGPSDVRAFDVLCRGFDDLVPPYSTAGFQEGEDVFLYINDRQALDANENPITFTFQSSVTTVSLPPIKGLGPSQYFREKTILSIESSATATPGTVLIDTGLDSAGASKGAGQVIFSTAEIPTSINPDAIVTIEYNAVQTIQSDIAFFKTKFKPIGTRDGFKISNVNVVTTPDEFISVPEAFALTAGVNQQALNPATFQSVAIFVDGINITSLLSPIGPKSVVADDGATLLPGQVAFNPTEGAIKFFKQRDQFGNINSEAPSDYTRITTAYFRLDTKFIFNTVTDSSYDPAYDINNDGRIDEQDLSIFTRAFGSEVGDPNYLASADFNGDGKIDTDDLDLFRTHFGTIALGEPDFADATSARLNALLVTEEGNFLNRIKVIKAVSRAPDAVAPTGRTILFFDDSTPVTKAGNYVITFGFQAALSLGFIQTEIETVRPLAGRFNLNTIKMFETGNPTNTRQVIFAESSSLVNSNGLYNTLLTFSPAISVTSEFTIRALWSDEGVAIFNRKELILPQKYELLDRKAYGPFKLQYSTNDFRDDGTSIAFRLKVTDATFADGSPDSEGIHIQGVPLSELAFTVHLTIPNGDGTSSIWTWHQIRPMGIDNKVVLNYNDRLFIDHRTQGRNNAEVLTPFGLGQAQISLKPKYTGGDLENDLANVSVLRSDLVSPYVERHDHSNDRSGGLLTSHSVLFADDLARLESGDLTNIIYKLLDIIEDQQEQIELIRALEGVVRWDRGLFWDDPNLFWDSN